MSFLILNCVLSAFQHERLTLICCVITKIEGNEIFFQKIVINYNYFRE